jgi:DNA-binding HxlR family transcriptional regulator
VGRVDTISLAGRLADRGSWTAERCAMDRALAVTGTRSAMLLLREAIYGTRRFDQFARRVGISEPVAAARLRDLVENGLLTRRPYQEPGHRTRYEYELTDKGREFGTVLIALLQWGNRWESPQGAPTQLVHADCGEEVTAQIRCTQGHHLDLEELELHPGPGSSLG